MVIGRTYLCSKYWLVPLEFVLLLIYKQSEMIIIATKYQFENLVLDIDVAIRCFFCYISCSPIHSGLHRKVGSRRERSVLLMRLAAIVLGKFYYPKFCCFWCRYLVTTFKVVPKGTEGAVSAEGTFAGFLASIFLACTAVLIGEV